MKYLSSSQGDFTAIVDLPEGEHQYKFYVDGDWLHNPDEVGPKSSAGAFECVLSSCVSDHTSSQRQTMDLAALTTLLM